MTQAQILETLAAKAAAADAALTTAGRALAEARALLRDVNRNGPAALGNRANDFEAALLRGAVLAASRHLELTGARAARAEEILRTCSDNRVAGASIADIVRSVTK